MGKYETTLSVISTYKYSEVKKYQWRALQMRDDIKGNENNEDEQNDSGGNTLAVVQKTSPQQKRRWS